MIAGARAPVIASAAVVRAEAIVVEQWTKTVDSVVARDRSRISVH